MTLTENNFFVMYDVKGYYSEIAFSSTHQCDLKKSCQLGISECGTSRWRLLASRVTVASFFLVWRYFLRYNDRMLNYTVLFGSVCV